MSRPSANTVAEWLLRADWRAISAHLGAYGASSAVDFKARAFLRIQTTQGQVDWPAVVADLTKACELEPGDPSHWLNLSQGLLDAHRPQEGFIAARRAHALAPGIAPVVEKLQVSAAMAGCQAEALLLLREVQAASGMAGRAVPSYLEQAIDDLASKWWLPLENGSVRLRRIEHSDQGFLESLFSDREFREQYNIFQEGSPESIRTLIERAQNPPRVVRRIDWVIEDEGAPVGIAALVDIDPVSRRAEVMFGFPGPGRGVKKLAAAIAIMEFSFLRLGLHKLSSSVYANNPKSQAYTLWLGFREEGLRKEHVYFGPEAGWIDMHINGFLKADYLAGRFYRPAQSVD